MSQTPMPPRRPTFVGTGGRDPRQPFGGVAAPGHPGAEQGEGSAPGGGQVPVGGLAPGSGGQPRPPRHRAGWVAALAVVLLVALGVWAASRWLPDPSPAQMAPSASHRPSSPTQPSATPGSVTTGLKNSVPFENSFDGSKGAFTITNHAWTSQGLVLQVRVHLDQGEQKMVFFCLDNASTHDFNPSPAVPHQLDGRTITAGQTLDGVVVFDKPRGDTTVFLAGSDGRQVAALVVTG